VLTLDNISKSFGGRIILDQVTWSVADDARVGLVGLNGAGKSTLLKLIAGKLEPDSGRITKPQRSQIGYLEQDAPEMGGRSLLDETLAALAEMRLLDKRRLELEDLLSREHSGPAHDTALEEYGEVLHELERHDFYMAESRAVSVLFGLGFRQEDLGRDVAEFSGGIRMRIALAKLLLQRPEFLMLDEPTNHLDLEARHWLEEYLENYPGGIILVSHDHYFLDRVTRRTVEVARGRLTEYAGNYSYYLAERERRFAIELTAYRKQQEEIEHMEAFISRFRYQASKAKLVQSRIKQLEKMERLQPPPGIERPPAIRFPACERSARRVIELRNVVKRFGTLTVYDEVSLEIERGARIALVGPNGAGKSTMMRILAGLEKLTAGERIVGERVRLGYFAQNLSEALNYSNTVFDEVAKDAEGMTTTEIRNLLGAMLFSGDEVNKRVGVLSGGERGRLALAKVLARRNNCLLLDEPTNNLDIVAKEVLLEALKEFPGTIVLVSHDRYILNQLVQEVIEVGHGQALRYVGNYDDYLKKKAAEHGTADEQPAKEPSRKIEHRNNARPQPPGENSLNPAPRGRERYGKMRLAERQLQRERAKLMKARTALETQIEEKESERAALGLEMNDPNFYLGRPDARDIMSRYETLGREIEELYERLASFEDCCE
jgi:ATP-binding cassette subfamily F protein 3